MNMIQKTYKCVVPGSVGNGYEPVAREYEVSAWMAMGSNTVNYRLRDGMGWFEGVYTERLSDFKALGVRTMDALIEHLYWVVKA